EKKGITKKALKEISETDHAPEMQIGKHDVKVDMWGVGFLINSSEINNIDSELKSFARRLCDDAPKRRPNALDVYGEAIKIFKEFPNDKWLEKVETDNVRPNALDAYGEAKFVSSAKRHDVLSRANTLVLAATAEAIKKLRRVERISFECDYAPQFLTVEEHVTALDRPVLSASYEDFDFRFGHRETYKLIIAPETVMGRFKALMTRRFVKSSSSKSGDCVENFLKDYLFPNVPLLIGPELTASWRVRKEWVVEDKKDMEKEEKHGIPNFEFLISKFGDAQVCVADCSQRYFTDQVRSTMLFRDFVDKWRKGRRDEEGTLSPSDPETKKSLLYLKDWHFVKAFPEYDAYEIPSIFKDDWMNEFWLSHTNDDYRFVYMGGDRTFTPLHCDVYHSYSWSSNICGTKKWTLFPPGQESLFKDNLGNMIYDVRHHIDEDHDLNINNEEKDIISKNQFPNFKKAHRIIVCQNAGETLFVPSSWYHMVENIGDCISINHNWAQSTAFPFLYESLNTDLAEVEYAIRDLKSEMSELEFVESCQRLLLINSGWDWIVFWRLISCVSRRLIKIYHDIHENNSKTVTTEKQRCDNQSWEIPPLSLQPPLVFIFQILHNVIHDYLDQPLVRQYLTEQFRSEQNEEKAFGIVHEIDEIYSKLK
ncbi:9321_t:CDS:2, partial [Ambispora gerdemannii]